MAQITVTKLEAAQRQVDSAIKLLFEGGDPVAVHTLAMAAERVSRDLCQLRGAPNFVTKKAIIRPGKERDFWNAVNKASNFLKHSDRDPDAVLEIDEALNDHSLMIAISNYSDLGNPLTPLMGIFHAWYAAMYPDVLTDTNQLKAVAQSQRLDWLRSAERTEQIKYGLAMVKSQ